MPKTITYTNGLQNLSGSQLPDAIIRLAGKVTLSAGVRAWLS
jgi:hypothetical protein